MKTKNTVFQRRINDEDLELIKKAAKIKRVSTSRHIEEVMVKSSPRLIAKANK